MARRLVAALVLVGLARLTAARVPVWQSDATLWADAVRQQPTSVRAVLNAGLADLARGNVPQACHALAQARVLNRSTRRALERDAIDAWIAHNEAWIAIFRSPCSPLRS